MTQLNIDIITHMVQVEGQYHLERYILECEAELQMDIDTMSVAFALFFPLIIDFGLLSLGSPTQEEAAEKQIIQYPNPLYLDYVLPGFICSKI